MVERIPLVMVRPDLGDLSFVALPTGYSWRLFSDGDDERWADIETRAGEFASTAKASEHFAKEFGPHIEQMKSRCLFVVEDASRVPVGTATAWYGTWDAVHQGRLHWVGLVPELHGRGIGKALVSLSMQHMASLHSRAFLTTQTTSYVAVSIYLDFGFLPALHSPECRRGWNLIESLLERRNLSSDM